MTSPSECPRDKLQWPQPLGLWRARGATATALRLGMGLPPMSKENAKQPEIDNAGYSLWHYWAESPRPIDLWSSVQGKLLSGLRDHKAASGEHPWHRLAIRGHENAMRSWGDHFEIPFSKERDLIGFAGKDSLLACAVWSGNDALVAWLLSLGVEIDTQDEHGQTPLMIAIHRCAFQTVHALMHHGANPDLLDERGRSAMHHAAQCEHADVYAMIEDCGGESDKKDVQGQTPENLLERAARTPQQSNITQFYWNNRYQTKLLF